MDNAQKTSSMGRMYLKNGWRKKRMKEQNRILPEAISLPSALPAAAILENTFNPIFHTQGAHREKIMDDIAISLESQCPYFSTILSKRFLYIQLNLTKKIEHKVRINLYSALGK